MATLLREVAAIEKLDYTLSKNNDHCYDSKTNSD